MFLQINLTLGAFGWYFFLTVMNGSVPYAPVKTPWCWWKLRRKISQWARGNARLPLVLQRKNLRYMYGLYTILLSSQFVECTKFVISCIQITLFWMVSLTDIMFLYMCNFFMNPLNKEFEICLELTYKLDIFIIDLVNMTLNCRHVREFYCSYIPTKKALYSMNQSVSW